MLGSAEYQCTILIGAAEVPSPAMISQAVARRDGITLAARQCHATSETSRGSLPQIVLPAYLAVYFSDLVLRCLAT